MDAMITALGLVAGLDDDRLSPPGAQNLAVEIGQGPVDARMLQFRRLPLAHLWATDRLPPDSFKTELGVAMPRDYLVTIGIRK